MALEVNEKLVMASKKLTLVVFMITLAVAWADMVNERISFEDSIQSKVRTLVEKLMTSELFKQEQEKLRTSELSSLRPSAANVLSSPEANRMHQSSSQISRQTGKYTDRDYLVSFRPLTTPTPLPKRPDWTNKQWAEYFKVLSISNL